MISPPKASFQTPHWNVSEACEVLVGDGILDITLCVVIINALDMVKCRILLPDVTCMFSVKLSRQQPVTERELMVQHKFCGPWQNSEVS